jgi:MFS family permease
MSVNEKPVASTGMRVLAAFVMFLAGSVVSLGIAISESTSFNMLWNTSERLGVAISTLSLFNAVIMLVVLFLYPLFGFLAGRFGKAYFVAGGTLLIGLSIPIVQFAPSLVVLAIGRLLGTLGMILVYSGLLAYLMEAVTSRWFLACAAAGYVAIGVSVNIALNSFQSLPKDANGVFLVALASAALGLLLGGALMLANWFIRRRYRWPDEWLDEPHQPFSAINIVFALFLALCTAIAGGMLSQGFFFIALNYGSPEKTMSALQATWSIALLIGYLAGGGLADLSHWLVSRFLRRTFGRPAILLLGLLVACIGTVLLIAMGKTLPQLRIAIFVAGIGFGLFLPALLAHLAVQVRHQRRALLISGYLAIGILASVLSSFAMGLIGQATGSNGLVIAAALGLAASMGLAIIILILSLIRKSETAGQITNSLAKEA